MKILWGDKDGGKDSEVLVWGFEWKPVFSVLVLRFSHNTREAFHTHAFNAISWVLKGALHELHMEGNVDWHFPNWKKPIITRRTTFHRVRGLTERPTYVLTFRGPWVDKWKEFLPALKRYVTLTHGRKEV